jgi:hypothetical protein
MGLIFLLAILLYVMLLVAAPALSYHYAVKRGLSQGKRRWAATIGFLLVFLPMFWDWIPTVWAFSYYCDNYAGPTVNKPPEQWKRETPGVAETLVRQDPPLQGGSEDSSYFQLNQRFRWERKNTDKFLTIVQSEQSVVDGQSGEILVRYTDFATRHSIRSFQELRDVKLWLNRNSCAPDGHSKEGEEFGRLRIVFENLGSGK